MFWWGIFTSCAQIFTSDEQYYSIIGPIFITSIIFGLSGLPVLEYGANRFSALVTFPVN